MTPYNFAIPWPFSHFHLLQYYWGCRGGFPPHGSAVRLFLACVSKPFRPVLSASSSLFLFIFYFYFLFFIFIFYFLFLLLFNYHARIMINDHNNQHGA
jgi:hypothetical protein